MGEARGLMPRVSEDVKTKVAALKLEGLSNAEIGARVGASVDTVKGMVKRMGLSMDAKLTAETARITRTGKQAGFSKGRPGDAMRAIINADAAPRRPLGPPPALRRIPPAIGLALEQLDGEQCHWPDGDGPFVYCGGEATHHMGSTPYCEDHFNLGFKVSATAHTELVRSIRKCL